MHGLPARLQVLGSGLLRPALEVEPQDDGATLGWIRNLMVGRKAALLALWKWLGSLEDPLNCLRIRSPARTCIADRGNLMDT